MSFEAKISIDIQQTFFFFCNSVSIIEDKFFCYRLLFQKNVKSHVFLKSEKNEKYVFSNTALKSHKLGVSAFFDVCSRSYRHTCQNIYQRLLTYCLLLIFTNQTKTEQNGLTYCIRSNSTHLQPEHKFTFQTLILQ